MTEFDKPNARYGDSADSGGLRPPAQIPAQMPAQSPDNSLPPIEPPSMKFIVQLFVIPGVIVGVIVLAWFLITQLTQAGNDPHSFVQALRKNNESRWHAAVELAGAMHDARSEDIKKDEKLAGELADILADDLKTDNSGEETVRYRMYLCHALGEFAVERPLPVLLTAAKTQHRDEDVDVRIAAVQSIALLADNVRRLQKEELKQDDLLPTLLEASKADDGLIRSAVAFTLGVIGGEQAIHRLEEMTGDEYPDARFNAATGLARYGNTMGQDILLEMLDPEAKAGVALEKMKGMENEKRWQFYENGLRAVMYIAEKNPTADLAPFIQAGDKLSASLSGKPKREVEKVVEQIRSLAAERKKPSEKP